MRAERKNGWVVLRFQADEAGLIQAVLRTLAAEYAMPPAELDASVAAVWYSTRGCQTAGLDRAQTAEWIAHLHQDKAGRAAQLRQWAEALDPAHAEGRVLRVRPADAQMLMMAINDHRLSLAARHGLGEAEMNIRTLESFLALRPEQRAALAQIEILAWLVEALVRLISPEAGDWSGAME